MPREVIDMRIAGNTAVRACFKLQHDDFSTVYDVASEPPRTYGITSTTAATVVADVASANNLPN